MTNEEILERIRGLGIRELRGADRLHVLNGDYVNLECRLPNGTRGRILDDNSSYQGFQVPCRNSDRCYGVAADDQQIAVFTYGCGGTDAELVMWVKL